MRYFISIAFCSIVEMPNDNFSYEFPLGCGRACIFFYFKIILFLNRLNWERIMRSMYYTIQLYNAECKVIANMNGQWHIACFKRMQLMSIKVFVFVCCVRNYFFLLFFLFSHSQLFFLFFFIFFFTEYLIDRNI